MTKAGKNVSPMKSRFFHSFSSPDQALNGNRFWSKPTIEEWRKSTEPYGFKGDASLGTPDKGKKIFEAIVTNIVEVIHEINNVKIGTVNKIIPI
jgi:creatinine amidohydrolase/Fe(II)-dependent formamide hydrolase-like protein